MQTYGKMLDLRESSRRHNRPGRKSDATFEAFEVKLKDDIKAHEAQMEDLRQEYDQAIRESKRLEWKIRRLTGDLARSLPGDSPAPVEQPDQPEQPEEPRTGDVEHRLADMERKLDLILKALEVRGGAKDQ